MDKDESFDRLATRMLRARTPAAGTCLDAETLAAWSSGSLASEQRAVADAHLADCDRCLAILSTLESVPAQTAKPAWASWRWLVPLTTAAAALTVFVLMYESQQPQSSRVVATQPVGETAPRAEPEAKTSADAAQPAPLPGATRQAAADERERSAGARERGAAPAPGRTAAPANKERVQQSAKLPYEVEQKRDTFADAPGRGGTQPTGAVREDAAARAEPSPTRTPPPPASPPSPSANTQARDLLRGAEAAATFRAPVEISTPDPAIRWRIFGRVVERSADGGRTWQRQDTGADGTLIGGSAPSAAVFWIVGADGLVLLTGDGRTWRVATRPALVNLVAVVAADAMTAVVTTADGRAFRTTDGGRTWVAQEKPPAPF